MGARFRLRPSYPLARFSPAARVVLRAMKRYGLLVADNGSDWYFQGTVDPRWTDGFVDQLKQIRKMGGLKGLGALFGGGGGGMGGMGGGMGGGGLPGLGGPAGQLPPDLQNLIKKN